MKQHKPAVTLSPALNGARLLDFHQLERFVDDSFWAAQNTGSLGALIVIHPTRQGASLPPLMLGHALCHFAALARQTDAASIAEDRFITLVLPHLACRGDAVLVADRIADSLDAFELGWEASVGLSVFPLCGPSPADAWKAAVEDMDEARGRQSGHRDVCRDTLRIIPI
jgi:hypothetical protein